MAFPTRQSSIRETAISVGVLVVLAGVVVWLLVQQRQFSPAVSVASTAALAAQRGPASAPAAAATVPLLSPLPAELKPMSAAEAFTPATLSDKIDGKAELYLSAGFVAMRCQRLVSAAQPGAWFEGFIYDMGKPENAFAVYSLQKRTSTQDAKLGDYGYRAGNQLCLVHGQFYLEFVGADETDATYAAATSLAQAFVAATTVARHANVAQDEALFPTDGLVAGSVMLLSADVFGFDQLNNTYVARYREGGDIVTLYLSRRASPTEATAIAKATRGFFVNDCGGTELPAPATPTGAVLVDAGGTFDGLFASGPLLAGVHNAPNRASAERWLRVLSERLASAQP